jgi:Conserved TM helix
MQNIISTIGLSVDQSLSILVTNFILYIPKVVVALLVAAIGIFIGRLVYKSFLSFCKVIRLDNGFRKIGMQRFFDEVGLHFSLSVVIAWCFRFIIDFVTLLTVLSLLGFTTVVKFVSIGLVSFVPTLATVAILLVITFVVANKVKDIVLHSTLVTKNFSPITARLSWLLVVIVGFLTVLDYLKIADFLVNLIGTFVTFSFAGLALAFALAFGLGAREEARCLVRGWMGKDCDDLDCGCDEFDIDDIGDDLWEDMDDDVEIKDKGDVDDDAR